jgi:uncharacterized protein YndB with AHSA1/START domain
MNLVITREFDAPRDLVYRAFVDPDQIAAWFGPVGWSVPRDTIDMDVRVGGHEKFVMVSDENPEHTSPVNGTFTEVIENELLVGEEVLPDGSTLTARFEFTEKDGRTLLTLTQGPFDAAIEGQAREGWGSSFTKLDALLAKN